MRTRAENLSILRNASGGSFSAGGPSGERVRSRDESLRILGSPLGGAVERSETEGGTTEISASAQPPYRLTSFGTSPSRRSLENGAPVGEPWNPHPSAPSTSSGAYAPPSPQGEGRSAEQGTQASTAAKAQMTQSEAQAELDRLKPVLEEAKQYENEMGRYVSGAGRDQALYTSALTKRNSLLKKYGYSSVDELNKAVVDYTLASGNELSFMQKLDRAGYNMEEGLKNTVFSGDWWKNVISGGAEQWAGSQLNAAGTTAGNIESIGKEGAGMVYENELRARNDWATTLEEAKTGVIKMDAEGMAEIEGIIDYYDNILLPSLRSGVQAYEMLAEDSAAAADEITAKGQQNTEEAKEGLGWGGQLAVDLLTQGTMIALDKATGAPNISMFTRGLGSGAQEARQEGSSAQKQIGYGAAVGTVEVLTNKLFDGLAGIYGKGAADELVEATIAKLAKSRAGQASLRLLASGGNEALEEILADAINPLLRTIYSDKSIKEEYSEEQLSQWLYDGLVGWIMGTGLTAVNPETYVFNPGKPQISADQEKTRLQPPAEGQTQAPQPGTEQKNTAPEEAESTAVNTDPAQHTAVEQAVIDEYQAAVDDNLRVIVEGYKANPNRAFARHTISQVTEGQAKDAENLLGGSYTGFTNAINSNGIKHILKEHGENGVVDHSMADVNDLARIAYVLDNYDTVNQATYASGDIKYSQEFRGKNNRPAPMLVFAKKVNGTYYVIEAVPDTQYKKFWVVSAYMEKKGGVTQAPNAQGQGITPETSLASSPPETNISDNSIVQIGEKYNSKPQPSTETGNTVGHSSKGAPLGGAVERSETEGGTTAASDQAAKTDPAAAARRQQYQTEITAALEAGDYRQALKLFNEFGNPNLRALNDFQTLKAFGDYAAAMGYDVSAEDISADEILAAFEESYQNAVGGIENNGNNDIINEESIDEIDLQSDYGKLIDSQEKVDQYYARAIKSTFKGGTSLAKKVFLKYVKPDSVASTTANSSFFRDGKVHLCAAKDINRKTGKVKYYFHEHGHYIDSFAAGSTNEDRLSMLNIQFGRKLRSDYATYLQKTMNEYGVSQEEAEKIIKEGLEDHKKDGVSDIIDGITDGKVYGYARHSSSDPNYWKSPGKVEREAFANMFQSCFEPKTIKYMAEYFPEAYKEFKRMLKGLI